MIKRLLWGVVGLCVLVLMFNFIPISNSQSFEYESTSTSFDASTSFSQLMAQYVNTWTKTQEPDYTGYSTTTFPEPQAALASGLWGTSEELTQMINNSPAAQNMLKDSMFTCFQYIGTSPSEQMLNPDLFPLYDIDKFKGPDGVGMVRYPQYLGYGGDDWLNIRYSPYGSSGNLLQNACGVINTACALSTISKRWVHPCELLIVMGCRDSLDRVSDGSSFPNVGANGAASVQALADCVYAAGFTDTKCGRTWAGGAGLGTVKPEVDACLDAGGIVVMMGREMPITEGGHYFCVYDRVDCNECGEHYLVYNTVIPRNKANASGAHASLYKKIGHYTWDFLSAITDDETLYIYPHNDKLGIK